MGGGGGDVAVMGEISAYSILVGIPVGKRPFGRPRCRWEDINMILEK